MTEIKISDFKMFEKAPYELPDAKPLMDIQLIAFGALEKLYGPVVTALLIKYALQFIAQRIGEKPPEDIKTLAQLANYLLSKTDKYPFPDNACCYAQMKAENELQGRTGTTQRVSGMGYYRHYAKSQNGERPNVGLDDIISNLYKFATGLKICPNEFGYKKNEDGVWTLYSQTVSIRTHADKPPRRTYQKG